MDADERVQQKRLGYTKLCLNKEREIPVAKITLNHVNKHVTVQGQVVVKTCEHGSLTYHKFHNIEKEVQDYTDEWLSKKKLVASTVSSRIVGIRRQNKKRTTSSHERKTFC